MGSCPACNSTIADDNAVFIGQKIEAFRQWDAFEGDHTTYGFPEGKTATVPNLGNVTLVKKSLKWEGDVPGALYHGEYPQGTEFTTFLVFEYNGRHFRKDGTGDSYGDITWSGLFREVFPKQKTITVYDFDTAN